MDNKKLVEAVQDIECLWKMKCRSYKDNRPKENTWKEVAIKVSRHKYIIAILIMQVMKVL